MLYDAVSTLDPIVQKYGRMLVQYFNEANVEIDWIARAAGPAKFSVEDQAADPTAPLTRVVKDVLRVGGFDVTQPDGSILQWNVSSETLYLLEATYKQFREAGGSSNLYWGASTSGDQHDVSAEKAIGAIDSVFVADQRLWVVVYVTPETAVELQNPKNRVSAAIDPNWSSGQIQYPLMMTHVAIVDQPVVGGQLPFARLSNQSRSRGFPMTPEQIKELVTASVTAAMQPFADKLNAVGQPQPVDTAALEAGIELRLSNKQAAAIAKNAFTSEVDTLFSDNCIDAATKDQLLAAGEKAEFDKAILVPFKALRLSNQQRKPGALSGTSQAAASPVEREKAGREAAAKWFAKKG